MTESKAAASAALVYNGRWSGYYNYSGKQYEMAFTTFKLSEDGKIRSSGNDLYGNFTMDGTFDAGTGIVTLNKFYSWPSTYTTSFSGFFDELGNCIHG